MLLVVVSCLTVGWTMQHQSEKPANVAPTNVAPVWRDPASVAPAKNILFIIADDMSPLPVSYGNRDSSVVLTPAIDRLAGQGVSFGRAFCVAPSCSPSRAAILTSRYPHQLAEGVNLWGTLPVRYANFVTLLEGAGYRTGFQGKGWGPGDAAPGGYAHNPAGPSFNSFAEFMASQASNQPNGAKPFCFWIGPSDPHRPYDANLKNTVGLRPQHLNVPAFLPDTPQMRDDLLDYYAEVARFEQTVADAVTLLEKTGQLQNTLIVVTSDNGMPFPRAKANLYDAGSQIPLVISGGGFAGGKQITAPVSLLDIAPTLLEWAGLSKATGMEGWSLMRFMLNGSSGNEPIFIERERHALVREGNLSYPARAIRTPDFLYIRNLKPERWPAGDPEKGGPDRPGYLGPFGDIDGGPGKIFLLAHRAEFPTLTALATAKRPADELYDLRNDPDQVKNVAADPAYRRTLAELRKRLSAWQKRTADPRLTAEGDVIDKYPYYGGKPYAARPK